MNYPKALLDTGTLKMGIVSRHKQLKSPSSKQDDIQGGGMFDVDEGKGEITLYGKSVDYGHFEVEPLKNAIQNKKIIPSRYADYQFFLTIFGQRIKLSE